MLHSNSNSESSIAHNYANGFVSITSNKTKHSQSHDNIINLENDMNDTSNEMIDISQEQQRNYP